jgi:hypothetical protein
VAQHDYIIANQSGAAFRADLNVSLAAIATNNSADTGSAEPSTTYRYQWWADNGTGLLKIRNSSNNGWITIGTLADANLGLLSLAGGTLTGNLTLNAQSDLRLADSDSSNWVALQAPATVATNLTLTAPAADGTADQALVTDGSGALSFASRSRLVRGTAVATTSGSTVDFTSLPSWIKRFTVVLDNVSVTGTDNILIQLGDSGGIETTGYISSTVYSQVTISPPSFDGSGFSSTSGIIVTAGAPQNWPTGSILFDNISGNRWIASGVFNFANLTTVIGYSAGEKTLSATLDRVRIAVTGTDTFDNGAVNIIYEG